MKIQDVLRKDAMILNLTSTSKAAVIDEMVTKLVETGYVNDFDTFRTGILNREALTTTGLGDGIAMPHAKNSAVNEATVLFAKSATGLDYESLDEQPTDLFFMIAAPEGANDTHLAALAELSQYLMKDGFANRLRQATTPEEVIAIFDAEAEKNEHVEPVVDAVPVTSVERPFIVAVTACTTGIAHTYMAEEALKKQAAAMGVDIKVETNGASGVGNRLTDADIARAKGVIVAADKAVEMPRFNGKPLVSRPVADGIKKTEELINIILNDKAEMYTATTDVKSAVTKQDKKSLGGKFYTHLMSGVSQMLPFVIGGGILIAVAFLLDNLLGVPTEKLSSLGSYNQIAATFMSIGQAAFGFMLPILAGFIAFSIAEKPGLVAGFVAGAIANSGLTYTSISYGAATAEVAPSVSSGFLGALVGGFVAGGVILVLRKLLAGMPRSLEGVRSILLLPLLGTLFTGLAMLFINTPMAVINTGLNNFLEGLSGSSAILMGLVLGGMMAIDMGGPVNKAAYVFGTGTLAATVADGGSIVMAAVMAGGMVPPIAVFFATLLFKDKFTAEERNSGLTNIIMGLSFITEGAIPYAAADPARAIPSFVVGSAISGALVGLAGIKLMAPHGGIFVIALTSNPVLYIVFVLIGAIVSAYLFGYLRKTK
ncbi:PTS fructose transporter subunit IIABC [Tuanshanicoccus lijuaniae]|uniref:PTS fructose transporter subunit IIABC n=1 Tax=Aerococcaceae bacterium zg-1292 TaxID=2774330 RepID=UPI001BD84111|nr:fructose-specific PTS transporter subunit EIIC [Aerococcaceae bacterium zg-A91]MBS4457544.1 fructose-specific PTS transporter subunit EIIC [Aerococcaceae bacterium zg-BR33]